MNKKQTIRLNESQFNSILKKIVKESVNTIINEYGQPIRGIKHIEKDYNSKDNILKRLYSKIDVLDGLLRRDYAKLSYLDDIRYLVKQLESFINEQEK